MLPARSPLTSVCVTLGQEESQLGLSEKKPTLAKRVSHTPGLQWQPFRSKIQGGAILPLLSSPMGSAQYYNKSDNCSFPFSPARSFVCPSLK